MCRLMSICIVACIAFGCGDVATTTDAGTDATDGPCADRAGVFYSICADDEERVITIYDDCSSTDVTSVCSYGCDDAGARCRVM